MPLKISEPLGERTPEEKAKADFERAQQVAAEAEKRLSIARRSVPDLKAWRASLQNQAAWCQRHLVMINEALAARGEE